MHSVVLCVLMLLAFTKLNRAICPSRCQCFDQKLEASCTDAGLEVVPIQLNPEVQTIILRENRIANVHYTLSFYTELHTLDLSVNKINVLGSHNFEFQKKLVHLNISYNEISKLSKDTFKGLQVLKTLDLSYNKISVIDKTAFRDTLHLELLILSYNNITYFEDAEIFSTLKSLRILKLDNNQVLDVPSNVLSNLPHQSLHYLYLNDNLIETVMENSFPFTLTNLHTLSLSSNIISFINETSFITLRTLHTLDLSYNNLSAIPTKQLSKLSALVHLDMSGNNFSSIDSVAFKSLFSLRSVQMNLIPNLESIDQRAFVDNVQLETVVINENMNLKYLPSKLFHGNTNLRSVSLKGNSLSQLEASHFPLERITFLDLSENPLQCDCSLLWLWKLVQLQVKTMIETSTTIGYELTMNTTLQPGTTSTTTEAQRIIKNNHSLSIVLHNLKCASPSDVKGKEVKSVPESHVHCESNTMLYAISLLLLLASSIVICILMYFIYRKRALWKNKINRNLKHQGSYVDNCLTSHPTPILMLYSTGDTQYDQNEKLNSFPNEKPGPVPIYDKYTGKPQDGPPSYHEDHIYEKEPLANKSFNTHYQTLNGDIPKYEDEYYPRKIPINDSFRGKISKTLNSRNNFPGKFSSNENFHCPPSPHTSIRRKAPSSQDVQYFDQWKNHSSGVYMNPHQHLHMNLESSGTGASPSGERRFDTAHSASTKTRSPRKQQTSPHIVYV
uniref:Leucine-rich repeat neuronal protein 2 n=1 Tax=Cacopsylla melanoneura TaxID=428564 RepID=A0A8D9A4Q5_9HEMI